MQKTLQSIRPGPDPPRRINRSAKRPAPRAPRPRGRTGRLRGQALVRSQPQILRHPAVQVRVDRAANLGQKLRFSGQLSVTGLAAMVSN